MATANVLLEVHVPGLDLHQERLLRHKLFIDIVHQNAGEIAAFGWHCYLEHGRGTLFVDRRQWKEGIKRGGWTESGDGHLQFAYLPRGRLPEAAHADLWQQSYDELVLAYDPERHVLLLVDTPPGREVSLYLLQTDPAPPEAYELTRVRAQRRQV